MGLPTTGGAAPPKNKKLTFERVGGRCSGTRLMRNGEHVYCVGRMIGGCLYIHDSPLSSILIHLAELYYLLCISPRLGDCVRWCLHNY